MSMLRGARGIVRHARLGCRMARRCFTEDSKKHEDNRDLILSVLRSTATKREARQYISRYTPRVTSGNVFERDSADISIIPEDALRIAVIKIRDIKSIEPEEIKGIGKTVSRLSRLGVSPIVVIDAGKERNDFLQLDNKPFRHYQKAITWKANLIAHAIESASDKMRARPIESLLEVSQTAFSSANTELKMPVPEMILSPLTRGIVPVVVPLAFHPPSGEEMLVRADDVVYYLTNDLYSVHDDFAITVEKVIYIDPLGGIPSVERGGSGASHVFVNLDQELADITAELHIPFVSPKTREIHLDNLRAMQKTLSILPLSATGLITTPRVAALSSAKNPLIYNVLTDRPVVSPSLPVDTRKTPVLETTIVRKGMPVTTLKSQTGLDLIKESKLGRIDLTMIQELIEDSFGRQIDMDHYLDRINGKVAGVIIAGGYQGAAIATWEQTKDGRKVPYLDKFAVRKSSQGGSGVADIVFKSLVMNMFPNELIWRSRATNPVNKWYFERSKGTIKIPNSHWAMFWTGDSTREQTELQDYLDICSDIPSSFKS